MQANIHPQYYDDVLVTCVCGASYHAGSTKPSLHVNVCAKCHPFYTGEQRFIDTKGKVEKFAQKMKSSVEYKAKMKEKKGKGKKDEKAVKSLRDLLGGV